MTVNKDYLTDLDSVIGDGDLGITMSKGFTMVSLEISTIEDKDIGNIF